MQLEQSVRSQERALADQMLQEDLRRAREIRQAAMDAKNGGSSAAATCQPPPSTALSASTLATSLRRRRSISPRRSPIKGELLLTDCLAVQHGCTTNLADLKSAGLGMSTTLSQARAFGKPGGAVENVLLDENKALRDRLNGKTNEGFELQRQLNRAQEAAREKDRVAAVLQNQVNRNDRELKVGARRPSRVMSPVFLVFRYLYVRIERPPVASLPSPLDLQSRELQLNESQVK